MYQIEEHLIPLPGVVSNSLPIESSSEDDSCVEITSIVDENENELIQFASYLQINSDSDEDSEEDYPSTQPTALVNYSSSSDEENSLQLSHPYTSSNNSIVNITSSSTSAITNKRKRRQWTVNEKLYAIACFEKNNSKQQTAKQVGCDM